MLDNAVTAQYTHTLTVWGKVGGQYQCNVSNNKPSIAIAQLFVQGKMHKYSTFHPFLCFIMDSNTAI